MSRTHELLGFYPQVRRRVRYRGHKHQLTREDRTYLKRMVQVVHEATSGPPRPASWLVARRPVFREASQRLAAVPLALVIQRTSSSDMKRLAIWLLGRHHGTLGALAIVSATENADVILRREAARALKRKQAWAQLRDVQKHDPDERVRNLAIQHGPAPHPQRLDTFLEDVTRQEVSGQRPPLVVHADVDANRGRPPKSHQWIRQILVHIQSLVRPKGASGKSKGRSV